jgi:hypothetical protein
MAACIPPSGTFTRERNNDPVNRCCLCAGARNICAGYPARAASSGGWDDDASSFRMWSREDPSRWPLRGKNHHPAYSPSHPQRRSRILETNWRGPAPTRAAAPALEAASAGSLVLRTSSPGGQKPQTRRDGSPAVTPPTAATHDRTRALRELINYWLGGRKFPSVRAGCSLRSKGRRRRFAAIAIGPLLTLCFREPSPKATDGFHHFPAPVSGRAVEHASKIGPSSCRIDPRRPAAFERDGRMTASPQ